MRPAMPFLPASLILALVAIVLLVDVLAPTVAQAYIDPGTGSMLIQGLIAAVIGAGLAIKLFWRRIKSALTGKPLPSQNDSTDD